MKRKAIIDAIEQVAEALGDDLDQVVFVGGAVAALYKYSVDIRPTDDVDCIVQLRRADYYDLTQRLGPRGFAHVIAEGAPACRFRVAGRTLVDIMPTDAAILGFTNSWFAEAAENAEEFRLPSGMTIKAITPIYFLATKLEAFNGRGSGDYAMSHDLEDVVALLAAHPALFDEIADDSKVAYSVLAELGRLAGVNDFIDTIPFYFPGGAHRDDEARQFTQRLLDLHEAARSRGLL